MELSTKFICATREYATFEKFVPAPYFRRKFMLEGRPQRACLSICGLGFYELYVNGAQITKGALAPYISNPDDLLYYDIYEISEYLEPGENVIGILLGNGMQNPIGGAVWEFDAAGWRSAPKLALALLLETQSGEMVRITADESFRTCASPIIMDDLRAGEFYDARQEAWGWNLPGFDDSSWGYALPAQTPGGEAVICRAEPIVVTKKLEAVAVRKGRISRFPNTRENLPVIEPLDDESAEEGWLYDFGLNTAGVCALKVRGERGQKIVLQFGELLDSEGGLDLRAMMFLPKRFNHRDIYICKGDGEETYRPSFTYHGFRYCLVTGITEQQAQKGLLTCEVMNSRLLARGGFSCSDETANALWDAAVVSDLSNFYYFPTDCPHREKNGWTGDAALSAEQMLCCLSVENSFREWLRNIRKAQTPEGALPGIVPTAGWGFDWGNGPAWDCALCFLPYYTWVYRGDRQILEENADAIFRYLEYLRGRCDDRGLLEFGLGDWCHAGRPSDDPKAPLAVTDTLIGMDICDKARRIFEVLQRPLQKEFPEKLYDSLHQAAREHLICRETMTVLGECQTSQAMALYYQLFKEDERGRAFAVLLSMIEENRCCMDVGILGGRVLFHVLADYGEAELAFRMITQTKFPSYGGWIAQGATSLWESFQNLGDVPDSKNHHFWGDIISWFIKNLAGIIVNPYGNDCRHVELRPRFLRSLTHAQAHYDTVAGTVSSAWERKADGRILWKVEAAYGCSGCMRLPERYCFEDGTREKGLQSGVYLLKETDWDSGE